MVLIDRAPRPVEALRGTKFDPGRKLMVCAEFTAAKIFRTLFYRNDKNFFLSAAGWRQKRAVGHGTGMGLYSYD